MLLGINSYVVRNGFLPFNWNDSFRRITHSWKKQHCWVGMLSRLKICQIFSTRLIQFATKSGLVLWELNDQPPAPRGSRISKHVPAAQHWHRKSVLLIAILLQMWPHDNKNKRALQECRTYFRGGLFQHCSDILTICAKFKSVLTI